MTTIRVAILGCGGMAGGHAAKLGKNPDVEVVALCDVSETALAAFKDRHFSGNRHLPALFTDPGEMYRVAKPQAVVIVTPHTLHFSQGMQALAAGCHVLMEKPMVTSAEHAHVLAEEVAKTGRILTIGYNTSCSAPLLYLRDAIRTQRFGKLELVSGYLSQNWLTLCAGTWRLKPELSGGGQAYDSGAHILNSLCWSVESDIAEVFAFVDRHGSQVDINSSINIRFANNVMASIVVSGNCVADGASMHFMFERGRVDVDGWGGGWIKVFGPHGEEKPELTATSVSPDDNFIDAILGRAPAHTSPANGIVQSELMDAIYASAKTGAVARPARTHARAASAR